MFLRFVALEASHAPVAARIDVVLVIIESPTNFDAERNLPMLMEQLEPSQGAQNGVFP